METGIGAAWASGELPPWMERPPWFDESEAADRADRAGLLAELAAERFGPLAELAAEHDRRPRPHPDTRRHDPAAAGGGPADHARRRAILDRALHPADRRRALLQRVLRHPADLPAAVADRRAA